MGSTYIKEIVLNGFKSFGETVSIPLGRGFNAIVGPSGSGKSSIIDGLCFALGSQGKRTPYKENLTDLIFTGANATRAAETAEVTVVLDNSQNLFPCQEGKDLTISRMVTSKGESSYRLNGKRCIWEEIDARLALANIDPDGFNIVEQGKIGELTFMDYMSRRMFIESLAGFDSIGAIENTNLLEIEKVQRFMKAFMKINLRFSELFAELSPGGIIKMLLEAPAKPLDSGIVIEGRLRGRRITNIDSFSGGEKALVAAALLFAVELTQPSPFFVFDDIDVGLVAADVHRVSMLIRELANSSQVIAISNRKENAANAEKIFGVSLEHSISRVYPLRSVEGLQNLLSR